VSSRPRARRASRSPRCEKNLPFRRNFRPLFSCAAHSSKFRTLFQVAYTLSPLPATLTKTDGVYTNNSRSGTHLPGNHPPFISLIFADQDSRPICFSAPTCNAPVDHHHYLKSFSCSTYRPRRKCCKKKTYGIIKLFRCNTYKKQGGGLLVMLTKVTGGVSLPGAAIGAPGREDRSVFMPGHESRSHFLKPLSPGCRPLARMLRFGVP